MIGVFTPQAQARLNVYWLFFFYLRYLHERGPIILLCIFHLSLHSPL